MPKRGWHSRGPTKAARRVLAVIEEHWPLTPSETAKFLEKKISPKTMSSKYLHHFKRLEKAGLIKVKHTNMVYIAWPNDVERLRDRKLRDTLLGLHDLVKTIAVSTSAKPAQRPEDKEKSDSA